MTDNNLGKETTTRMADNKEDDVTIMKEVRDIFHNHQEHFHDYFTTVCTLAKCHDRQNCVI